METGLSKTAHTHSVNEKICGMVNLPLSDTFACASTPVENDAGFINQTKFTVLNPAGIPIVSRSRRTR